MVWKFPLPHLSRPHLPQDSPTGSLFQDDWNKESIGWLPPVSAAWRNQTISSTPGTIDSKTKDSSTLAVLNHTVLGTAESLKNPQIQRHSKHCLWAEKICCYINKPFLFYYFCVVKIITKLLFFKFILLIMLLQLSQFCYALYPPSPCTLPPYSIPPRPPLSSCPWVIHISSLVSPFPILFLTSPCLFCTYHLCYLFSVPFPPSTPLTPPLITLHVIFIPVILFLFWLFA